MYSNKPQLIVNWLSSCDGESSDNSDTTDQIERPYRSGSLRPNKKRNFAMDVTPVAKRQAVGPATLSLTHRSSPERHNPFKPAPSFHSSNVTSRSSSPSKRQRSSEIEFSNPSVEFYSAFSLPRTRDEAEIPSWTELMDAIALGLFHAESSPYLFTCRSTTVPHSSLFRNSTRRGLYTP